MGWFMSINTSFYNKNAAQLATKYDSLEFENVHCSWRRYWPCRDAKVLDIGAGSGRDARWFVEQGCSVIAVEPANEFRQLGTSNSSSQIQWLDDSLPALAKLRKLCQQYDLILVSTVWMHLSSVEREKSLAVLSELLSDKGKLVITLRHGGFDDGRNAYNVSDEQLEKLSSGLSLAVCHVAGGEDSLNRTNVYWQTVVLEHTSANNNKGR